MFGATQIILSLFKLFLVLSLDTTDFQMSIQNDIEIEEQQQGEEVGEVEAQVDVKTISYKNGIILVLVYVNNSGFSMVIGENSQPFFKNKIKIDPLGIY